MNGGGIEAGRSYTLTELAEATGYSVRCLRHLCRTRRLRHRRPVRKIEVEGRWWTEFLRQSEVAPYGEGEGETPPPPAPPKRERRGHPVRQSSREEATAAALAEYQALKRGAHA